MKFLFSSHRFPGTAEISEAAENDDAPQELVGNDDAYLVEETAKGDVTAFTILVTRHTPSLYRVAHRMLGSREEAEDIVQECFTRLWTSAPNWSPQGAGLVAWLHRVTMNLCRDRLRKPRPTAIGVLPDIEDVALRADMIIEGQEARLTIEHALATLPPHYRAALVLSYYEGLPNALAAEIMDLNIKALESLLVRARRQLRRWLELNEFTIADLEHLA